MGQNEQMNEMENGLNLAMTTNVNYFSELLIVLKESLIALNEEQVMKKNYSKEDLFELFYKIVNSGWDEDLLEAELKNWKHLMKVFYDEECQFLSHELMSQTETSLAFYINEYNSQSFDQPGILFELTAKNGLNLLLTTVGSTIKKPKSFTETHAESIPKMQEVMDMEALMEIINASVRQFEPKEVENFGSAVTEKVINELTELERKYQLGIGQYDSSIGEEALDIVDAAVGLLTTDTSDGTVEVDLEELSSFLFNKESHALRVLSFYEAGEHVNDEVDDILTKHINWLKKNEIDELTTMEEILALEPCGSNLALQLAVLIEYHLDNSY